MFSSTRTKQFFTVSLSKHIFLELQMTQWPHNSQYWTKQGSVYYYKQTSTTNLNYRKKTSLKRFQGQNSQKLNFAHCFIKSMTSQKHWDTIDKDFTEWILKCGEFSKYKCYHWVNSCIDFDQILMKLSLNQLAYSACLWPLIRN